MTGAPSLVPLDFFQPTSRLCWLGLLWVSVGAWGSVTRGQPVWLMSGVVSGRAGQIRVTYDPQANTDTA